MAELVPQEHGGALKQGPNDGNGGGRPRDEFSLTAIAKKLLLANDAKEAKEVVAGWIDGAKAANSTALVQLLERIDGKVPGELNLNLTVDDKLAILRKLKEKKNG